MAIAATDASKAEGNTGSTSFTFTVTRSGDTSIAASATYTLTGSGANAADATDFTGGTLPTGTVSFAAGETSKVVTINVAGDTTVETDEAFTVTLSPRLAGTTITTAAASGTIVNDDAWLSSDCGNGCQQGRGQHRQHAVHVHGYPLGRHRGSSVTYALTGSGANAADAADFTGGTLPTGRSASLPARPASRHHQRRRRHAAEANEGFTVTLSPRRGTTITTAAATGTIVNDDASASVGDCGNECQPGRGHHRQHAVHVHGHAARAARRGRAARPGRRPAAAAVRRAPADFAARRDAASGTLQPPAAGQTSQTTTVNRRRPTWPVEPDEGFTVTLSNASAGTSISTATATGTIRNDDFRFSGQQAGSLSPDVTASTIDGNGTPNDNIANATPASAATPNGMRFVGSAGPDTLSATGPGQILTGGAGVDTLVGYSGYGDIFSDTAAGLDGDTIINFGGSDVIDVTDLLPAATKPLAYVDHGGSGTLSVTDGTQSASINFAGSYSARNFTLLGTDGHGGTLIGYTAV